MKAKTDTLRTVIYHGYEFKVPASWPVYRLDEHPSACVRYDINAVYLGTPGKNMVCPATLIGRAQTVSVLPGTTVAAGSGSEVTEQRAQPDAVDGPAVGSLSRVHATVTDNASERVLRVALHAAALSATVLGTYGSDPAVIEQVLGTLRVAPKGARQTAQTGSLSALSAPSPTRAPAAGQDTAAAIVAARSAATGLKPPSARPRSGQPRSGQPRSGRATTAARTASAAASAAAAASSRGWPGLPKDWPIQIVPPPVPVFHPLAGFDTCSAPSLADLAAWHSAYSAIGVYIGGLNRACPWGNLSAAWFAAAAAQGWSFLPTYVGLQAPCTSATRATPIDPGQAVAEGKQAALSAIADLAIFGFGPGTPVYYDMEAYAGDASCRATVLAFLGAWDRALSAAGYRTGVYSSEDSAIADMQAATAAKTPGFTAPDGVWVAKWDGVSSLSDASLGDLDWPVADRAKQFAGGLSQTIDGVTLSVDQDVVGGLVAR